MNIARGFDDERTDLDDAADDGVGDALFDLGGDERRMHVRAYNHWVSLLKGRPFPFIDDIDPDSIVDFGAHSVLLDFTDGVDNPAIAFLGRALREECGLDAAIATIADVPSRSLLSRLTDHYLQIIANRAPIGFEAEFVGTRGRTTLYRGILMPFTSDGAGIDYIYGVINWKETVDAATQAGLDAELDAAVRAGPTATSEAPIWADGPSGGLSEAPSEEPVPLLDAGDALMAGSLTDRLALARESAAAVRAADTRSRSALYRALARAHDFGLAAQEDPDAYGVLLADTGITAQPRAPFTPVVKLVFGADYDKTRVTEFAAVLSHARRHAIGAGGLAPFLDGTAGGIKAIVAAERQARRPAAARKPAPEAPSPIAHLSYTVDAAPGSLVVLVARVVAQGGLDLLGTVTGNQQLAERALREVH